MTTRILKYLILLALALFIVAISSFWFSKPAFRERDVILELEGPTQISAGDEVIYKLKYSNETRSVLRDLKFILFYPEGSTVIADGQIKDNHDESFEIEELAPGQKEEKEFQAFLLGDRGNTRVAKAIMSFRAGNLNSLFEKDTSLSTIIIDVPIALDLTAPPNAVTGSAVQYILDYRNESDEDVSDLILELEYPEGFTPQEFKPEPNSGKNTWKVDILKKGSGGRISVNGTLNGQEGESKIISAKLKRKISGDYVDYHKAVSSTVISNPVFSIEILVNKVLGYSAILGDELNYVIKYSNNSNVNFSGVNLSVKLEGEMFDLGTLNTWGGFFDENSKTIVWNFSTVPDFSLFAPNSRGQISFDINIKPSFPSALPGSSRDRFVKVTARLESPNVPAGFEHSEATVSKSLITKISVQPAFNQSVYYNDSEFGSFGSWPLTVGEETLFTVRWRLTNPGNDNEEAKVTAKLVTDIQWTGESKSKGSQDPPIFNPDTSEIIWDVGKLPYGASQFIGDYEASFRIKVTPTSDQKGAVVRLLDGTKFTATDSYTKQNIVIDKIGINSDDLTDRLNEGTVQ